MQDSVSDRNDAPFAAFYPQAEGAADAGADARIDVEAPVARIGQGPQNDIVLDDDTVSTHHSRLEFADGGWRITDLDSKNGTYVDGIRLAPGVPTPLPENAVVAFGAVKLAFRSFEEADPEAAAASYVAEAEAPSSVIPPRFRLPLWLLLLILVFVALLVFLFLTFSGDPSTVEPVADPPGTAWSAMVVESAPP